MIVFRLSNEDKGLLVKIYNDINLSIVSSKGFIDGSFRTSEIYYEHDLYHFDIQVGEKSSYNMLMHIHSMEVSKYKSKLS